MTTTIYDKSHFVAIVSALPDDATAPQIWNRLRSLTADEWLSLCCLAWYELPLSDVLEYTNVGYDQPTPKARLLALLAGIPDGLMPDLLSP